MPRTTLNSQRIAEEEAAALAAAAAAEEAKNKTPKSSPKAKSKASPKVKVEKEATPKKSPAKAAKAPASSPRREPIPEEQMKELIALTDKLSLRSSPQRSAAPHTPYTEIAVQLLSRGIYADIEDWVRKNRDRATSDLCAAMEELEILAAAAKTLSGQLRSEMEAICELEECVDGEWKVVNSMTTTSGVVRNVARFVSQHYGDDLEALDEMRMRMLPRCKWAQAQDRAAEETH